MEVGYALKDIKSQAHLHSWKYTRMQKSCSCLEVLKSQTSWLSYHCQVQALYIRHWPPSQRTLHLPVRRVGMWYPHTPQLVPLPWLHQEDALHRDYSDLQDRKIVFQAQSTNFLQGDVALSSGFPNFSTYGIIMCMSAQH